jgi:hypothetical protein
MSESITLEINAEGDWDGSTEVELNRDNAVVTSRRYYKFNLNGPHGVLRADLGGLFSPVSMKLVGVGYSSWNPESKGRIIASDATGSFRQEITLKPAMQFVVMYPGDKLAFSTQDERGQLVLVVNELNEAEAVKWGLGHQPFVMPTRFRIIRHTGAAFVPNPTTTWQPDFAMTRIRACSSPRMTAAARSRPAPSVSTRAGRDATSPPASLGLTASVACGLWTTSPATPGRSLEPPRTCGGVPRPTSATTT